MEPLSLTALGGELRTRRSARGLSRATLAQAVGTRPVIIGRWERGEAIPTPEQVRALVEVLELPPSLTADWAAAAERVGLAIGPGGPPAPTQAAARGEWWLPRRRSPARLTAPADERPASAPPVGAHPSYLDDPAEQRRYALRWAVTLVILGALAILLIWSLGELADGWRALIELFRTGPTTSDGASACGLVGVV
ncbi:MAG TPA: helix-turn-helix transcriptional regulator [Acidimicrobiia bacterium]|nr:helix-turn-helix transcriptional regulator [Acidimicrobiia bacterium]